MGVNYRANIAWGIKLHDKDCDQFPKIEEKSKWELAEHVARIVPAWDYVGFGNGMSDDDFVVVGFCDSIDLEYDEPESDWTEPDAFQKRELQLFAAVHGLWAPRLYFGGHIS